MQQNLEVLRIYITKLKIKLAKNNICVCWIGDNESNKHLYKQKI